MLRRNVSGWTLAVAIVIGQALAYSKWLPLSLGPRVVLQPWLLDRGWLLYDQIADEHAPLLSLLLTALQPLAADSLLLAKTVLIVLLSAITLLAFFAATRAEGKLAGILAVIFMGLWSPDFGYGKLWHETLLALLYMLILLQWRPFKAGQDHRQADLVTGLLLGLAVLAKQYGGIVALGVAFWTCLVGWRNGRSSRFLRQELLLMAGAALIPVALFVAYQVARGGALGSLAFWTLGFSFLSNQAGLSLRWPQPFELAIVAPACLLLAPFLFHWLAGRKWDDEQWQREGLGLVLLVTGSLTIFPRFGFFHLQPTLPILAWVAGLTLVRLSRQAGEAWPARRRAVAALPVITFVALWLAAGGQAYWNYIGRPQEVRISEYSDLVPLAGELRNTIPAGESIYVMPDDEGVANLYYLLQTEPPHFWAPTSYPWFMIPPVRAKALAELRLQPPEWIIDLPDEWNFQSSGRPIIDFVQAHYQPATKISWNGSEVQLLHRRSTASKR